jgi:uncharacterized protein (TIGR00369 family)
MNATELAPDLLQAAQYFFDQIPFNSLVGIQVDSLSTEEVRMHVLMREDLVGNHIQGILHGGVIASILDVAGGAMALLGALQRLPELPVVERMMSLSKLGTIDMRVDYLRPGRGQRFDAVSTLLRTGNKVAVVRTELHNDDGYLIAVSTGTYLVG